MNGDAEAPLMSEALAAHERADAGWRVGVPLLAGLLIAVLVIHWTTVESIVSIWWRSETFAHGFLIVPITLTLVWRQRHVLAAMEPSPDAMGLAVVAVAGAAWLTAYAGEVLVLKQLALVATLWGMVIAIVGRQVARALTFPLGFLILGVPMGEARRL
jgi:transmembrane exosortase EpsH